MSGLGSGTTDQFQNTQKNRLDLQIQNIFLTKLSEELT